MAKTRSTIQKKLILEALKMLDHPSADEVYSYISEKYPSISRGTVYRNLSNMAEQGDILRVKFTDGADRFDTSLFKHYHLKCRKCGRVLDVNIRDDFNIEEKICDEKGFLVEGVEIVFTGLCPDCK